MNLANGFWVLVCGDTTPPSQYQKFLFVSDDHTDPMDMNKVSNKLPELSEFPPKLRKLGLFIINSGQLMTLKEAYESTCINYQTIRTQIMRCKKKGLDFHRLVDTHVIEKLRNARPDVYKNLLERAISGSAAHTKLFSQLVGDYTERQQIDHNVKAKIVVFSPSSVMPEDIRKEREAEEDENGVQIIDTTFDD